MNSPRITFGLFAYNQAATIREAVEAALAQDYSPMQIILSDDCSQDRTFELMSEMAARYSGPNEIVLNRNRRNLGIGLHVSAVQEMATGEFMVVAAGDDISLPHRTSRLVGAWLASNRRYKSVGSHAITIDETGAVVGESLANLSEDMAENLRADRILLGATHGWSREVFDYFGPLLPDLVYEDVAISVRSSLLGEVCILNEKLVKYRLSGGAWRTSASPDGDPKFGRVLSRARIRASLYRQIISDTELYLKREGATPEAAAIHREAVRLEREWTTFQGLIERGPVPFVLDCLKGSPSAAFSAAGARRYLRRLVKGRGGRAEAR